MTHSIPDLLSRDGVCASNFRESLKFREICGVVVRKKERKVALTLTKVLPGPIDPLSGRTSISHGVRIFVPINSDRALLTTPSALRGEAQMVSPARRTECVSFDNSRVLCAWICLLLQSAQPRLASAILESVILALSSLSGTIGQNFLRLRRAELQ